MRRVTEVKMKNMELTSRDVWAARLLIVVVDAVCLMGCQSGMYKISTSEDDKSLGAQIDYTEVDSLPMNDYDSNQMPVEVIEGEIQKKHEEEGLSVVLCFFSLGIFPWFESSYETQDIEIKTPIGKKRGTWRIDAKRWTGWLPIFIGYPGIADERTPFPYLGNERMEQKAKSRLVDSLVRQFSHEDYVAFAKKENANRKSELKRIADAKEKINALLSQEQYDDALTFCDDASGEKHPGSLDCDAFIWENVRQSIIDEKEDHRVAVKKADLEKKIAEQRYEDVVAECEKEKRGEFRHISVWTELKDMAEKLIAERDRRIELSRIETRKAEIESLLNKKDYNAVFAECAKETCQNVGSRQEDAAVWENLRNQAEMAQDKIDREAELSRIELKVGQIEKWFEEKNYDAVITACNEEFGTNPGSRAEDVIRMKEYRSKALRLRLLQKVKEDDKSTLSIKGFSLNMSMEEVEILLSYHFPSISYTRREWGQIKIAGHSMVFCQANNDRVIKFNFNREMLETLFDYDAQDIREWATMFAHEYGMDLRYTSVCDRTSRGDASISVSQDCYVNRDRKKGVMVSIFGEQDVSDYNKDPEEIEREATAAAWEMMSSGIGDNSSAYNLGFRYGRMAQNVKSVREWLEEKYVNGKGAENWTLRIETLK